MEFHSILTVTLYRKALTVAMTPKERKIELMRAGVTMISIARRLGITVAHVSMVVGGKRRSPRVENEIAAALRRPVGDVFEPATDSAAA